MGGLTQFDQQVDQDLLADLNDELDILCDYADWAYCPKEPAEWIARTLCPECGARPTRLLCTPCKDLVMTTEHGCWCPECEARVVPFRAVFTSIEPLKKAA